MKATLTQYAYRFGGGTADGHLQLKTLLGGKGAGLAEMSRIGLPVPPGFTLTTHACHFFHENGQQWPEGMAEEVETGLRHVEEVMGKRFGDEEDPLLLSIRSGAAVSMPGMMDTVLDLGLNMRSVEGLAARTNARFAWDTFRRFVQMFGNVVRGIPGERFEEVMDALKEERGAETDLDLDADALRELTARFQTVYEDATGESFPDEPREQLRQSIDAVFTSWNNDRAVRYRRINHISGLCGTGVNVQAMVYGNSGEESGTGVCFTRDPATGENTFYGEFLQNAQGEDVVAGVRTPQPIERLQALMPEAYDELLVMRERLEEHFQNMQDFEFTIEDGTLYILQTRDGKRTGPAALRIALEMVEEGLVDKATAVRKLVEPRHLEGLLHPRFADDSDYADAIIGEGLPASPGAAVGQVVFTADDAEAWHAEGKQVLLVRQDTSPEDVGGMDAAEGILTSRGGMTSHATVVARGWGKPCVVGCSALRIDAANKQLTAGEHVVQEGDWFSINGTTGEVVLGQQPTVEPELSGDFAQFMDWVDEHRRLRVRANADTPEDARHALDFGAEGIGLCRTEHMFFGEDRILAVRRMILAQNDEERHAALAELLPLQRGDFEGIFRAMDGLPVTVRLLDPPLHEFLPHDRTEQDALAEALGIAPRDARRRIANLEQANPMLGHRGCRLGITQPAITRMQTRALLEAALRCQADGVRVELEIMVPLVGTSAELEDQRKVIEEVAEAVLAEHDARVDFHIGTMIEMPRAAITAYEIAQHADFFSFGTNDLTQMTFGYSRDDTATFLPFYIEHGLMPDDPFQVLDRKGVGALVEMGTDRGRKAKPNLKVGICGEHGGEPASVTFCHEIGLDYVSCSPFRVPIARLAAAQAHLRDTQR